MLNQVYKLIQTASYHPQANSRRERRHREIGKLSRIYGVCPDSLNPALADPPDKAKQDLDCVSAAALCYERKLIPDVGELFLRVDPASSIWTLINLEIILVINADSLGLKIQSLHSRISNLFQNKKRANPNILILGNSNG